MAIVFGLSLGVFCWQKHQGIEANANDIFNENQYLFASQNKIANNFDFNISSQAFLLGQSPIFLAKGAVLAVVSNDVLEAIASPDVEEYIVQEDDTIASLAIKFAISKETIAWANNLTTSSKIKPGQKLIILPVSGVLHLVDNNETVSEIAKTYKVSQQDVLDFNGLDSEGAIFAGDFLIIPNAVMPQKPATNYRQVSLPQSYFICPISSPCYITQGLHWYNAVDVSNGTCGDPIYAAAAGTVQKTGYGARGGYYVVISHANGAVTYYGHMSKITTKPGAQVYQGKIIGYVGHTGHTIPAGPSGCHVHFEVRFANNPFLKYAVGAPVAK